MSDVAALIADMVRAGVDPDIIGRTAATLAGLEKAAPKTPRQERNARYYQKRTSEKRLNQDERLNSDAPLDKENPQTPKEINPPYSPPKGGSLSPAKGEIDKAIEAYSEMAARAGLAVPRAITPARRQKIAAKLKAHGFDAWLEAVNRVGSSEFCTGKNDRGWRADIEFMLQDKSFLGLLEGRYGGSSGGVEKPEVFCPEEIQTTKLHVIRYRNEHDGADPPRGVQGGKAGYLIPATWVKSMQMRQAHG